MKTWLGVTLRGLLAGALAGLVVLGLLGRAAMAVVGHLAAGRWSWTVGGTLEVLAMGLLLGAPAGVVFAFLERAWPGGGTGRGALLGLAFFGLLLVVPPPAARAAATSVPSVLVASLLLLALVFALFGLAVEWLLRIEGRRK